MVRHIAMWNFKVGFSDEENLHNAQTLKAEWENLSSVIEGIVSFEVIISALKSGNRDIMLNSLFTDAEALAAYQVHPEHVRVNKYAANVLTNRACVDYLE